MVSVHLHLTLSKSSRAFLFGLPLPLVSPRRGELTHHQTFMVSIRCSTAYSRKMSVTPVPLLCVQKSVIPHAGHWALKMRLLNDFHTLHPVRREKPSISENTDLSFSSQKRDFLSRLHYWEMKLMIKGANLLQLLSLWRCLTNFPW